MTYPLIFNKLPSAFEHQCTIWVSPSSLVHQLMEEWYCENVPKGECVVVDVFSPNAATKSKVSPSCWYVVDLRQSPAIFSTNKILLEGLSSLSSFDQGQVLFDLYSRVKGLVVLASKVEDVPLNIQSLSVLTMTSDNESSAERWQGTHRFEEQQKKVHWPCW
jgi:hypothetical protein